MTNRRFQTHFSGSFAERAKRRLRQAWQKTRDRDHTTYLSHAPNIAGLRLFQPLDGAALDDWQATLAELGENYLGHKFDILGSGWQHVHYGMACGGLEGQRHDPAPALPIGQRLNPANAAPAGEIRALLDADFAPIDWQLDIKSGYRWREDIWYRDIRYRNIAGADAKVPWELARMHHLPQLALAYGPAREKRPGFRDAGDYAREFRNQALDFIAANPPRFGINWSCTMDVAIRAVNLLASHDLLRAYGHAFEAPFENIFWRAMREHGRHIVANFERHGEIRNNHYLANITGLLFIGAYLPNDAETDVWLEFASREFLAEAQYQFLADGSNFEASTSYHRLGAEMVLYGAALLLAIGAEPPDWLGGQLKKMAEFCQHISTPSGRAVQIGDNDSGRFVNFFPAIRNSRQDHLDHRHVIAGISALCGTADGHPEGKLVAGLTGSKTLTRANGPRKTSQTIGCAGELTEYLQGWQTAAPENKQFARFALAGTFDPDQLACIRYADFGLYIMRSPELYLTIRCGGENAAQPRGHAHNDQLAIELWIDGKCVIADPGSYLYTPVPERRNAYRSVKAHFTPQIEGAEPASLEHGLFALGPPSGGECRYFGAGGFVGRHNAHGAPLWRAIALTANAIEIFDMAESPAHVLLANEKILAGQPLFSPGYGLRRQD